MRSSARELWLATVTMVAITGLYMLVVLRAGTVPPAGALLGHGIGIFGFALMLMTETLYSLRKRTRNAHWGRMSRWLQFHIFTGLVGPYLVFLHTAFHFNGLAGAGMLMTLIVVASGVLGRYIYAAIPRSSDGIELQAGEVERAIADAEAELRRLLQTRPQVAVYCSEDLALAPEAGGGSLALNLNRRRSMGDRLRQWRGPRGLDKQARSQLRQLERMLGQRQALQRQALTLTRARRALAVWHAVHIPLGLALFTAAFVHAGAALYYGTLLR